MPLWGCDPTCFVDVTGHCPARSTKNAVVVTVIPDVAGLDGKTFDYLVPEPLRDQVRVGTMVRIRLAPRRVGAWVVAVDVPRPAGVTLKPIAKVTGFGPSAGVIDLARWASW